MFKFRVIVPGLVICLVALASQTAEARRSIRVDLNDSNFINSGEAWNGDTEIDLTGDGSTAGNIRFQLNFGSGAANYDFLFSENGFVSFFPTGTAPGANSLPPTGTFIAPFAADLSNQSTSWGYGQIDTSPPYEVDANDKPLNAVSAIRFTWTPTSGGDDVFQVVLLDRSGAGQPGDFDLELNYGRGSVETPTSDLGQQGFSLGANQLPLHDGPFRASTTPDYYFRNGLATAIPEPATTALLSTGLLLLIGLSAKRKHVGSRTRL